MAELPAFVLPEEQPELVETPSQIIPTMNRLDYSVFLQPTPLQRPFFVQWAATARAINRDRAELNKFKGRVLTQMRSKRLEAPYYHQQETKLYVVVVFRIRRPNIHYVSRDRSRPVRLDKIDCPVTGGDVDNLAKFVLDAMNRVIYVDDRQVMALTAAKIWCDDPDSLGSTTVSICPI